MSCCIFDHRLALDTETTQESKSYASSETSNESFEAWHVAPSNTLGAPWAVMVEILTAVIAEGAVLCVDSIFPPNYFTLTTESFLADRINPVKV
jgi:hypothetical protein